MSSLENIKEYPHNQDAEEMLISQLLLDGQLLYNILDIGLEWKDFYDKDLGKVYNALLGLIGAGKDINFVLVKETCGIDVSHLMGLSLTGSGIKDHAVIIKENSIKRKVIKQAQRVESISFETRTEINDLRKEINKTLDYCNNIEIQKDFNSQLLDFYEELHEEPTDIIKTNYKNIDKKLRLSKGQLVTIAGRPGMGKSAVMGCLALSIKNVAFFSLEMQNREIAYRMASSISQIPYTKIANGIKNEPTEIQDAIRGAFDKIAEKELCVYDKKFSLLDIKLELKKIKAIRKLDVVFIDYLQLMKSDDSSIPRALQIGKITRELKALAKELNVCIIQGSQLNRGIEGRIDKTPRLSDLRESGDIEQDSDIVLFIDRDLNNPGSIDLIVAKNRNGKMSFITLEFKPETMTLMDTKIDNVF